MWFFDFDWIQFQSALQKFTSKIWCNCQLLDSWMGYSWKRGNSIWMRNLPEIFRTRRKSQIPRENTHEFHTRYLPTDDAVWLISIFRSFIGAESNVVHKKREERSERLRKPKSNGSKPHSKSETMVDSGRTEEKKQSKLKTNNLDLLANKTELRLGRKQFWFQCMALP